VLTGKPVEEPHEFLQTLRLDMDEFFAETLQFWDMPQVKAWDLPKGDDRWLDAALAATTTVLHIQVYRKKEGIIRIQKAPSSYKWNIDEVPII
jgi:hypothetical protein